MKVHTVPDLSAHDLQAVCTLAQYRSFIAAALTLNVSQPALTRALQRVEDALGVQLFRRSTRKVALTPAGQEFVGLASRILADLRIGVANMRDIAGEQRGRVTVSAVMSVACTRLPDMIAGYHATRPRIEVHLREGVHGTVLDDVQSGAADFGLTYIEDVPAGVAAIALGQEEFHVVMPRRHALARQKGIALRDLAGLPLVSLPPEAQTRRLIDAWTSIEGMTMQHAVTVTQFATAMRCVQAGVGLCVVPGSAIPSASTTALVSRPLIEPKLQRSLGIVTLDSRDLAPSALGLLTHINTQWMPAPEIGRNDATPAPVRRRRTKR